MIKPLTSLRFIFALFVFLSHYYINGTVIFPDGFVGVSFFYMLSGFILAYSYKSKIVEKQISYKQFITARVARIYPLHILTFLIVLFAGILLKDSFEWKAAFFNLTLLQSFIPDPSYYFSFNAVSWSISDEMFFYLLFPFIIIGIMKIKRIYLLLLFSLLIVLYFLSFTYISPEYYHAFYYINPFFRILDFMIGIFIYEIWLQAQYNKDETPENAFVKRHDLIFSTLKEVLVLLLLVGMFFLSGYVEEVFTYASFYWIPMGMTIYIFARTSGGGYLTRLLSWKVLVVGGEISFGFYMIHTIIIRLGTLFFIFLEKRYAINFPAIVNLFIIFTIVIMVSLLSYYYFEKPLNRTIKKKILIK